MSRKTTTQPIGPSEHELKWIAAWAAAGAIRCLG